MNKNEILIASFSIFPENVLKYDLLKEYILLYNHKLISIHFLYIYMHFLVRLS